MKPIVKRFILVAKQQLEIWNSGVLDLTSAQIDKLKINKLEFLEKNPKFDEHTREKVILYTQTIWDNPELTEKIFLKFNEKN